VNRSASFLLGALTVGALGIAAPSADRAARETITLHVGDSLAWHFSVRTDTVLGVVGNRIVAKHCGIGKTYARPWKLRAATHDSVPIAGDSVTVNVTATATQPCTTEVVVPVDTSYHVFAASDFENGTIGGVVASPFWNPYAAVLPGALDVVSDPTNSGHGKVLRIHYFNYPPGGNYDSNDAIQTNWDDPATHATNGDEVIFDGDFYLPRSATTDTINRWGLRKLNYWCSAAGTSHACLILTTQPSQTSDVPNATTPPADEQLQLSLSLAGGPSNLPCDCPYYGIPVTSNAWHHVTLTMRLNSTNATKDGRLRLVFDGRVIDDRTNVQFVDPLSTVPIDWYDWRIGEQVNSSRQIDEYRYWDNLKFAVKRAVH